MTPSLPPSLKFYAGNFESLSFQGLSEFYLDTFCQGWNDDNAESRMLPPKFSYKYADVSDEAYQLLLQKNSVKNVNSIVAARKGDSAEHMVFSALERYGQLKKQPIIVFHGFKVDDAKNELIASILGKAFLKKCLEKARDIGIKNVGAGEKYMTLETDFLVIHKKVGIILVEVKGGEAVKKFPSKSSLPVVLKKAIEQLMVAEVFLHELLHELIANNQAISSSLPPVYHVIVAPELLYAEMISQYGSEQLVRVLLKNTEIVCKEHLSKDDANEGLEGWFDDYVSRLPKFDWNSENWEQALIHLAGIFGMYRCPNEVSKISLSEDKYSRLLAVLSESLAVKDQFPTEAGVGRHPFKLEVCSLLKPAWEKASRNLPNVAPSTSHSFYTNMAIVMLSPDQNDILHGGLHQILLGPAGTGKTLLLMGKAIELMSKDRPEEVLIVCAESFMPKYKEVFDVRGLESYLVMDLYTFALLTMQEIPLECSSIPGGLFKSENPANLVSAIRSFMAGPKAEQLTENELFQELFRGRHIFLDDTLMQESGNLEHSLIAVIVLQQLYPDQVIWMAGDPFQSAKLVGSNFPRGFTAFLQEMGLEKIGIEIRFLHRVMRYAEKVYSEVFRDFKSSDFGEWNQSPVCGTKKQGLESCYLPLQPSVQEAAEAVSSLVQKLHFQEEVPLCLIAVVLDPELKHSQGQDRLCSKLQSLNIAVEFVDSKKMALEYYDDLSFFSHSVLSGRESSGNIISGRSTRPFLGDEAVLNCRYTNEVPSFEWPIIIYMSSNEKTVVDKENDEKILRYLMISRCTTFLIVVPVAREAERIWSGAHFSYVESLRPKPVQ